MTESVVEEAALAWLEGLGYEVKFGPDIAPGELFAERSEWDEVVLAERLKDAIDRLNAKIPQEAQEEAFRKVTILNEPSLIRNNRAFHKFLTDGVPVEYQGSEGRVVPDAVLLFDFENPENNDWLAVNQFAVIEGDHNRRPDIVIFVNGLPLIVIELKNPADEDATIWSAFNQLQTYKHEIPSLFAYNEVLVISDGVEARLGSLTADREWFLPWRTIEGEDVAPVGMPQLQVLLTGLLEKKRLLEYINNFVVFEDDKGTLAKKIAGYHQYHAVLKAVKTTIDAARPDGDRRCGVVWHTQGSGKSLTMTFFARKVILRPEMENPTIVVLTDRNDLDGQLFGNFARCSELLRQDPVQADSRADLRELLKVASGGIVFTTIQKFLPEVKGDTFPMLSERRNIVVIADEAHRSQYDFIDGYARHMRDALPKASFIGFTGTPLELTDRNTRAVFGDHISVYDIKQAVEDGATVPIYYEGRLAKIELKEEEKPKIDPDFEEATEGEEVEKKEELKTKWARLEAMVGTDKRIGLVAEDLVRHFEQRQDVMEGKALVVGMSRRICVSLYDAIVKLRPNWHNDDDKRGGIKVVMTGSASDPVEWQGHIRNKPRREALALRFKDSNDPLRVVIVRDMWLTGFDVPCLHTMYVDKPMRGHGLMQAIARVNRVFRDKPGGLVVDYLGLATELQKAMANYTESGGKGKTAIDQAEALAVMLEKYETCCDMFHGFDYSGFKTGKAEEQLSILPAAQQHILSLENGAERFMRAVTDLSKAFALAVPAPEAIEIRDDVGFFQAVRSVLRKTTGDGGPKPDEEVEHAIKQIVSRAVAADDVVDIFSAAGLKKPDISILSDEFLAGVKTLPHKNLAAELLRKLLSDEIRVLKKTNLVKARSFAEMLEKTIRAYQNRSIEVAAIIQELIDLAKEMREARNRGEELGLSEEEVAFYDALEVNDSAVQVLGDETLRTIAQELVETVHRNTTIDWTVKEAVRAKLRTMVKRVLRKHGYPPDKQEKATRTVLEQAELLCELWAA
ncbi:MAG: DEAD/DEAH box helicase [Phycisphaerae bacterium SM1_79]|nr:MAG: DEAD/DEAH box helicase [Phycisphaerae bacterium SM1_79]